jgi:hypothetical protein
MIRFFSIIITYGASQLMVISQYPRKYTPLPKQLSNPLRLGFKMCDASLLPLTSVRASEFDTRPIARQANFKNRRRWPSLAFACHLVMLKRQIFEPLWCQSQPNERFEVGHMMRTPVSRAVLESFDKHIILDSCEERIMQESLTWDIKRAATFQIDSIYLCSMHNQKDAINENPRYLFAQSHPNQA